MDWIDLAQDRDSWRALANTVMILRVSIQFIDQMRNCQFLKKDSAPWS